MKRMLAFLLCWTMLLSQLVMLAEAAKMQDQSDIFYLEENGIHVEDGAEVIMDQTPLGKSEPTDRYSPSVPKFVPEALYDLGIEKREEPQTEESEDEAGSAPEPKSYTATIKSDKVMMYGMPRSDAESVYLKGCAGKEVELIETDSFMWFYMEDVNEACQEGYAYIYAEDVVLKDKVPSRGITATVGGDRNELAIEIVGAPEEKKVALRQVEASRAPKRNWRLDGGTRTLLASYKIDLTNPDGSAWQPGDEPVEVNLTLPEIPELTKRGKIYVEQVDDEGNAKITPVSRYFMTNTVFFKTDCLSEIFVYTVDYPESESEDGYEDVAMLKVNEFVFFSKLYRLFGDPDKPFEDIEDISFSHPEKVRIEKIYNDERKAGDWRILLLEPLYETETFTVTFKQRGATRVWENEVVIDASGEDLPGTLKNNHKYFIARSFTHTGDVSVAEGGTGGNVCFGTLKGSGRTLTMNGTFKAGAGRKLYFTINTGVTSHSYLKRPAGNNDQLVAVSGGAKFVVYGGATYKLVIDGDNDSAYYPLISVTDNNDNHVYLESVYICRGYSISTQYSDSSAAKYGYPGGGMYFAGGTLNLGHDVRVYDNSARMGGGLYLAGDGTVKAWDGNETAASDKPDIYDNWADVGECLGAGIYMGGSIKYQAHLEDLNGNVSNKEGGGLYMAGGTFAPASTVRIHDNSADNHGGGIYMAGGTLAPVDGVVIHVGTDGSPNYANYGAGVYVKNGTFNGKETIWIRYNEAYYNGGGLMVEGGTLTFSGTQAINIGYNKATDGYGGGLNVCYSGKFNDTSSGGISIYGNTATTNGGGVYLRDANITTNGGFTVGSQDADGVEKGNYAPGWGSGMCIWSGTFTFSGAVNVQYNDKDGCGKGGGIYIYGGTITCSTGDQLDVHHNKANYGGGIYIGGSTDSATDTTKKSITFNGTGAGGIDVYSNTGDTNGGGIMAENCTWTNATPLTVRSNTTPGNGGGININGWVNRVTFTSSKKFSVTSNTATGNGGGIWNNSDMTITADVNCSVESNTATGNGGGIYNGGNITLNSKYFVTTNTAQDGGGIYHNAGTIQLNTDISIRTNTAKGNGGGIYSKAAFNMTKGAYVGSWAVAADNLGNKAVNGAGIFLAANTFTVDGTLSMGHNIASSQGGGIFIQGGTFHQKSGTLKLGAHTYSTSTAVAGNEANGGGGLCMTGGTFKCEGTLIMNGNKAKTGSGGGILADNATSVSITGTGNEIKNNIAQAQGGAMRCFNTNTTVK